MSVAKFIRTITVAPIMAFMLLVTLYFMDAKYFGNLTNYIFANVFLVVLPIIGYPLQPLIPGFKNKGREGQRNLAILMAVVGYISSIVYGFFANIPKSLWIIFLGYLLSGLGIVVFNKVVKLRASGHACGVIGPLVLYICLSGISKVSCFIGLIVTGLIYWSSLKIKRHTISELIYGSIIPVVSILFLIFTLKLP